MRRAQNRAQAQLNCADRAMEKFAMSAPRCERLAFAILLLGADIK